MRIVVQFEPDEVELVLDELNQGDFIVDQNTYCYFRDEVFIKGIEYFIRKIAPGSWKEMSGLRGADRVKNWYDNQDLIYKYYQKYRKHENKYHLYKNDIYIYNLIGFINVGNEIQLFKLDIKDVLDLLNRSNEYSRAGRARRSFGGQCPPYTLIANNFVRTICPVKSL